MTNNSIWVVGAAGRLGKALIELLKKNTAYKIIATDRDVDITNMAAVSQAADIYRPAIIINCAGIPDVEFCESSVVEAFKVNALGARNLAAAARSHNAKIIQPSTDDIFNGYSEGVHTEFDMPVPITVYGKSKLAGENFVRELNPKHLIIRSSWVYGAGTSGFFADVLEKGKNNIPFSVAGNDFSTPTNAMELARVIIELMNKTEYGIYHASCEGKCSRYEFAKAILANMGYDTNLVTEVMNEKKTSTVLENLMMKMTGICEMPKWEDALADYIKTIKEA